MANAAQHDSSSSISAFVDALRAQAERTPPRREPYWSLRFAQSVFRLRKRLNRLYQYRALDYQKSRLLLMTENFTEHATRARSCQKEPDTILWLETFGGAGKVFYDLGANVGAYSLVAAARGMRVVAIEPAFQNYARLCQNVTLNRLDKLVSSLPVALSSKTSLVEFSFLETRPGSAKCFYNQEGIFHLPVPDHPLRKHVMAFSLDDLIRIFNLPAPNIIKIDVDGAEAETLSGAHKTFSDPGLSAAVIEIDTSITSAVSIHSELAECGLTLIAEYPRGNAVFNYYYSRLSSNEVS